MFMPYRFVVYFIDKLERTDDPLTRLHKYMGDHNKAAPDSAFKHVSLPVILTESVAGILHCLFL